MSVSWGSIRGIFAIGSVLVLTAGCASVPTANDSATAQARKFQPDAGTANVYLCRHSAGFGDTLVADVNIDGKLVGSLAPNTFLLVGVSPGHHVLTTYGPSNEEHATLDAVAGTDYFFNVSISYDGPMIRHRHISAMTDADGRAAVDSDKLAVGTTTKPD